MNPGTTPTTTLTDGSTSVVVNNADVTTFEGQGYSTPVANNFDFCAASLAAANTAYNTALTAGKPAIDAARLAQQALRNYEGGCSALVTYAPVVAAPATAAAAGVTGQIAYDATHIYVCVATNTWVRATLATW